MGQITTIIQGPAHDNSLSNLDYYRSLGPVIISCSNEDNIPYLGSDVTVIQSKIPYNECQNGNIDKQVWTTLLGLQATQTPLFIKTRSDEKYCNLEPLIQQIEKTPGNFTSNNIFYKGCSEPMHPSDHLFGGSTILFKMTFSLLFDIVINLRGNAMHGSIYKKDFLGWLGTEVAIFTAFLTTKGLLDELQEDTIHDLFLQHTEVVDIDLLGPYIWTMTNDGKKVYSTDSTKLYEKHPSLKSKNEYYTTKYIL
jgi:hypothetical protein